MDKETSLSQSRQEIPDVKRKDTFAHLRVAIDERVLERGHRKTRIVRITRFEWTPRRDLNVERALRIAQCQVGEGKARLKRGFLKTRQPAIRRQSRDTVTTGVKLPAWNRSFQNTRQCRGALQGERREHQRFILQVGVIAQ